MASLASMPDNSLANVAQPDEARADIKVILFGLRPEGFEPNELELSAGEYLLIVRNRTGLDEVKLRLRREGDRPTTGATALGQQKDWKQRVQFMLGSYLLSVADKPEWTCRIIVGP